jgi:hypothetical protein
MCVSDIAILIDWRHSRRTLSDLVARLRPESAADWSNVQARPIGTITAGQLVTTQVTYGTMKLGVLNL